MNKDKVQNQNILGTLVNKDESGIIAYSDQIYDKKANKSLEEENAKQNERLDNVEAKDREFQTTLENITKTGEASAASNVTYNHNDSKLDATNVQQAIDEVRKRSNYNDGDNIIDFNTIHLITDNPEYICVAVDTNDRILYGIKTNGQPYFGVGCPQQVKDYIDKQINKILGTNDITTTIDSLKEIEAFLKDFTNSDTLKKLLDLKANVDEVKATTDDIYKKSNPNDEEGNVVDTNSVVSVEENPEYIKALTDSVGKLIEAIGLDGVRKFFAGIDIQGVKQCVTDNPEYIAIWLDNKDKILFGVKVNGDFYFGNGLPSQIKEYVQALYTEIEAKIDSIIQTLDNVEKKINLGNEKFPSDVTEVSDEEHVALWIDEIQRILESIDKDGKHDFRRGIKVMKVELITEDEDKYISVFLDSSDKIIRATKADGTELFNVGVDIAGSQCYSSDDNEYVTIKLDGNGKVLEAVLKNGKKVINIPVSLQGVENGVSEGEDIKVEVDSNDKLLSYRDSNGVLHEPAGIETGKIKADSLEVSSANGLKEKFGLNEDEIIQTLLATWEGSRALHIVTVRKDGTGDFKTIQEAINSITDASVYNQYEVDVYDDYYINDLTELWQVDKPTGHCPSDGRIPCAYIITKDFVHLKGMGGKRDIYVESPDKDMAKTSFQNIHPILVRGNCRIENFTFRLKGGRYAIHQDRSGELNGPDSFKTTIYRNITAIHYGNDDYTNGSGWTSTMAQANGVANGQRQIFIDVEWISYTNVTPFYQHLNGMFTQPVKVIFINCRGYSKKSLTSPSKASMRIIDRYSCQYNSVYMYGCDIPQWNGRAMTSGALNDTASPVPTERGTKRYAFNNFVGFGNKPMVVEPEYARVLLFRTANEGEKVDVVGGNCIDDVWGITYKLLSGGGIKGTAIGENYLFEGSQSKVSSLPYILGNCVDSPKTLIVRITDTDNKSTDYTITFDKNYMTSDDSAYQYNTTPAISQDEIVRAINTEFGEHFTASITYRILDTWDDCKEKMYNGGDSAIPSGAAVITDYSLGHHVCRLAKEGEKPVGIASDNMGTGSFGEVLLLDKNLFHINAVNIYNDLTRGTYYKVGSNGGFVATDSKDDAVMVAVDNKTLIKL